MNTKVNITLDPREFDLLREAVSYLATNEHYVANDKHTDVKLRAQARTREAQLRELDGKLNS